MLTDSEFAAKLKAEDLYLPDSMPPSFYKELQRKEKRLLTTDRIYPLTSLSRKQYFIDGTLLIKVLRSELGFSKLIPRELNPSAYMYTLTLLNSFTGNEFNLLVEAVTTAVTNAKEEYDAQNAINKH